jgi:epoxyqueuosine reductase
MAPAIPESPPPASTNAPLAAAAVKAAARACQFALVGLAPADRLPEGPLQAWLAAGQNAGLGWMKDRLPERLDPRVVLPGARTVVALAISYHRPADERSQVARYARGRDYHYVHRDRLKALRKRLLLLAPGIETYACVDTGVAMEKPWAERAGLGFIGKNGCLITPTHGSWVTLSVMFLDRAVDVYDQPHGNLCGDCTRCLVGCPTNAFPSPGVVDARRCLAYHTIESPDLAPADLRPRLRGHTFGCDVCQEVCPFNHRDLPAGDERLKARPLGLMADEEIAALTRADFDRLAAGMSLVRAQYDGLRRNAILALSPARARRARPLLQRLCDDESPVVQAAARWVLCEADIAAASSVGE